MALEPRPSKISMGLVEPQLTSIQLLWAQLPTLKTHELLRWCAMQTDAKPPRYANRKCGLGDGGKGDLGWLGGWGSWWSQYMACSISRMSTSKWTQIAAVPFTRLEISTGKGRGAAVHGEGGTAVWRAFVAQPLGCRLTSLSLHGRWWTRTRSQEGARCSPEPSSLGTAACAFAGAEARCAVCEGRSDPCRVMQERETVLVPVT